MNALRERVSFAQRAGGRASRTGGDSFVNGACYNPRVLIALLNIYRVHYNFFEARQYVSPINKHNETEYVNDGTTTIAVPGSEARITVPKRRRLAPVRRTPAMRAGIHQVPIGETRPKLPDLCKVLYLPWLFHRTPLWGKLQGRQAAERVRVSRAMVEPVLGNDEENQRNSVTTLPSFMSTYRKKTP